MLNYFFIGIVIAIQSLQGCPNCHYEKNEEPFFATKKYQEDIKTIKEHIINRPHIPKE